MWLYVCLFLSIDYLLGSKYSLGVAILMPTWLAILNLSHKFTHVSYLSTGNSTTASACLPPYTVQLRGWCCCCARHSWQTKTSVQLLLSLGLIVHTLVYIFFQFCIIKLCWVSCQRNLFMLVISTVGEVPGLPVSTRQEATKPSWRMKAWEHARLASYDIIYWERKLHQSYQRYIALTLLAIYIANYMPSSAFATSKFGCL